MSDCKYFGLSKTCKCSMNCRDTYCHQHPDYYKVKAVEEAFRMQAAVGKRVRAYKNAQKYVENNPRIHGRLVKVFVKGNSVAYKVRDEFDNNIVTCSFIEIKMFQG